MTTKFYVSFGTFAGWKADLFSKLQMRISHPPLEVFDFDLRSSKNYS